MWGCKVVPENPETARTKGSKNKKWKEEKPSDEMRRPGVNVSTYSVYHKTKLLGDIRMGDLDPEKTDQDAEEEGDSDTEIRKLEGENIEIFKEQKFMFF